MEDPCRAQFFGGLEKLLVKKKNGGGGGLMG